MTTLQQLLRVFERVFEDEVDLSSVKPESELIADLGMSSIAMLYMAMELEGEFEIRFTNEDFSTLRTVEDVIRKIEGK